MNFDHAGRYSCQVMDRYQQRSSTKSATLRIVNATIPIPIKSSDTLYCSLPLGADRIEWKRASGKPLPSQSYTEGEFGEKLVISPVKAVDADEYICCGTSTRGYKDGCLTFGQIEAPPEVQIQVREPTGRPPVYLEGGELYLECVIVLPGYPVATSVSWTKDNIPYGRAQGRILRIAKLVTSDQGVYRCTANNGRGESDTDATEVRFGCVKPSHVRISVGDTHSLGYQTGSSVLWTCEADGSPTPQFIWFRNGNPNSVVSRQASLTINRVSRDSEGPYTCRAINSCGQSEATETLIIRNKKPGVPTIYPRQEKHQPGDQVIITCEANGGFPQPTLRWFNSSGMIVASSRESAVRLTFLNFAEENEGRYECRATNTDGSSSSYITLQPLCTLNKPVITLNPPRVSIGDDVTMTCSAGDSYPEPEYQWLRNGVFLTSVNPLRINNMDAGQDSVEYSCEVENRLCQQTKIETVTLRVEGETPSVRITSDSAQNPLEGTNVRYTCTAFRGDPTPNLEWQFKGRRLATVSRGSGTLDLLLNDIGVKDSGQYTCVGRNTYGSAEAKMYLQVTERIPDGLEIQGDTSYRVGEMIDLNCRVMGEMSVSGVIQWMFNGAVLKRSTGQSSLRLREQQMRENTEGLYYCRYYGSNYNMSDMVQVTLETVRPTRPTVVGPPGEEIVVGEIGRLRWECRAPQGSRVEWRTASNALINPAYLIGQTGFGIIRESMLSDSDQYYCVAVNEAGESGPSNMINITIIRRSGQVRIERSPQPNAAGGKYIEGTEIVLTCKVEGPRDSDVVFIEWTVLGSQDNRRYPETFKLYGRRGDAGTYQCTASYSDGTVIGRDSVVVSIADRRCPGRVSITGVSDAENYVNAGSTVVLRCNADAFPSPEYRWFKGAQPLSSNGAVLTITSVSSSDMGMYSCVVSVDQCADSSADMELRLIEPPRIISHYPSDRDLMPRRATLLNLTCIASGMPTPTITWSKDGGSVPSTAQISRDGTNLMIMTMDTYYDGQYSCSASNRLNSPIDSWFWIVNTRTLEAPENVMVTPQTPRKIYYGEEQFVLTCVAEGEQLTYQWRYKAFDDFSSPMVLSSSSSIQVSSSNGKSRLYFRSLDDSKHNADYWCIATNEAGESTSNTVRIEVSADPEIQLPCSTFGRKICLQSLRADEEMKLECKSLGKPAPTAWSTLAGRPLRSKDNLYIEGNMQVEGSDDYMCTVRGENSFDVGLHRVFVTRHPVEYETQEAVSVCDVETPSGLLDIIISLKSNDRYGLIYSYEGTEGLKVRLELQDRRPVLLLEEEGKQSMTINSYESLRSDEYTVIRVIVDMNRQIAQVQTVQDSFRGRDYTVPAKGKLSLMGEMDNERSGMTGVIATLSVNSDMETISACASKGSISTVHPTCASEKCGGGGNCVPAPTLQGYYCYCPVDGRPAMACYADGRANVSSITSDSFIMAHFQDIFGRASYADFLEIQQVGDGVYMVGSTRFGNVVYINGGSIIGGSNGGEIIGNIGGISRGNNVDVNIGGANRQGGVINYGVPDVNRDSGYNSGLSQSDRVSLQSNSNSGLQNGGIVSGFGSSQNSNQQSSASGMQSIDASQSNYQSNVQSGNSQYNNQPIGNSRQVSGGSNVQQGNNQYNNQPIGNNRQVSGGSNVLSGNAQYNNQPIGNNRQVSGGSSVQSGNAQYNNQPIGNNRQVNGGSIAQSGNAQYNNQPIGNSRQVSGGFNVQQGNAQYNNQPIGNNRQVSGGSNVQSGSSQYNSQLIDNVRQSGGPSNAAGFSQPAEQGTVYRGVNSYSVQESLVGVEANVRSGGASRQNNQPSNSQYNGVIENEGQPYMQSNSNTPQSQGQGTVYRIINKYSVQDGGLREQESGPEYSASLISSQSEIINGNQANIAEESIIESPKPTGLTAGFNGRGYLQLPKSYAMWLRAGGASFEMRTTATEGLMLYYGGKEGSLMQDSEYVALALQDGYVEMSYRLSRSLEPTRIRHSVRVNDGRSHSVSFSRSRGEATLIVDGIAVKGTHGSAYLGASGDIYIGGVPDITMVNELYKSMFKGCISNLRTSTYENSGKDIDLFDSLVKSLYVTQSC
ncbi:hemicentin-2-like isoform X2 [Watersipora subatra]|uniref:hemicentin-2-like isoform X2 n=1 Tax=Watersipora subatra TaxID=2589382 RepID=UPI00355B1D4C